MVRRLKVDHRRITKKDIFLKARMLSEGVRVELKKAPPGWNFPELPKDLSEKDRDPMQIDISDGDAVISSLKQQQEFSYQECLLGNVIIFEDAKIPAPIISNTRSPLTLTLDGSRARISERGQILVIKGSSLPLTLDLFFDRLVPCPDR